jgi:hypothetical protein
MCGKMSSLRFGFMRAGMGSEFASAVLCLKSARS